MNMQSTPQPITIRGLVIDPPLILAPMAGLTHTALRQIIAGFGGCGLLSTEMLSAKRLPTDSPRVSPWLVRTAVEKPLSYQILTSTPEEIGSAIDALHRVNADAIDINIGCPAPAVGKFGGGIKLMERPDNARAIVREARRRTDVPLTAKVRIGIEDTMRMLDFCAMLQDEGADLLSVHARLAHESFARRPRWEQIAAIKRRLSIPVMANGGIFSVQDARDCLAASGADGLMIGRGAVIRPWLFTEIAREVYGRDAAVPTVDLPALYDTFVRHLLIFRPQYRLGRLKEFTHHFARNFPFGHHLAMRVQTSGSVEEAKERAGQFFAQQAEVMPA